MKNLKLYEDFLNEGHDGEIGRIENVSSQAEAMDSVNKSIAHAKEFEGDLSRFRSAKWVGIQTEDGLDKQADRWEDEYVVVGKVNSEYWSAYWKRS